MTAEIGDIVRLRDMRFCFGSYKSMAEYFNLKNWEYDYWPKDPFSLYEVKNMVEDVDKNNGKERIVVHTQETTTHQDFMFNMDNLIIVKKPDFLTKEEMMI